MDLFKLLHILAMFAAVTFLVGEALLYARAIVRTDVPGLAGVRRLLGGRPVIGAGFLMLGIVFGVLAALDGGLDLLAGWLLAAYALVVAMFVVNATPWIQRLPRLGAEAIDAVEGRRRTDDVLAAMAATRPVVLAAVALNVALFVAVIADMVLKPF